LALFDTKLLKRPEFLLLLEWGFFGLLGYVTLLFSLLNRVLTIRLSPCQGSIVGAMANLGQAISRPIVSHFADREGCLSVATTATALAGLFCFIFWMFAETYAQAITLVIMSGAVTGTFFTLIAPVAARVVGLVDLPAGLSLCESVLCYLLYSRSLLLWN
jgi:hypothetical protein